MIPGAQERKLGDEERADLERQAADLGKQLEGGAAQPEQLQRAAAVYATLGRAEDAAGALEQLVEKAPGNSSAWGMLVRPLLHLHCGKLSTCSMQRRAWALPQTVQSLQAIC